MFHKKEGFSEEFRKNGFSAQSKVKSILLSLAITLAVGFVYFYIELPPINLHAPEFYIFAGLLCVVYLLCSLVLSGMSLRGGNQKEIFQFIKKQCKVPLALIIALVAIFIVGTILSLVIFRAGSYSSLLSIEDGDFAQEVQEISFDKIPMLDKNSAERLGDRKLGELVDMVSQFEVADDYTQINLRGRPVRVTPLNYGDFFKWFNNRGSGLPAYLVIDMVDQSVDVVRLPEGMKYSRSELFGRNINRHLRFNYPTYMFAEPSFEVDDNNNPYWVCPKIEKKIGLFGGTDIHGAVLVNAITGESEYVEEVPTWVDQLYYADLIIEQYDYYGQYHNGFFNSIFGQKGVTVTTEGYNYIAMNDDVYMYTGVTSVGGDQSNVGFLLSNQRTKETKYYVAAGATEKSAQYSAEGAVQNLKYTATFPLLLNIQGKPTYFMALKDNAQLVKMYAMVNVQQYQIVAKGSSVAECEKDYLKLLQQNNLVDTVIPVETQAKGRVAEIRTAVIEGNSYYYLRLGTSDTFYRLNAAETEFAVIVDVGDYVGIEYDSEATGEIVKAYSLEILPEPARPQTQEPEPAGTEPTPQA